MTNFLPVARDYYYNKRWGVIPLKQRSKAPKLPTGHDYLKRRADKQEFESFDFQNIGIVTGAISGIVVLDIDEQDKAKEWLEEHGVELPETPTAKTFRGLQFYFKHPGYELRCRTNFLPGMDFKGDGGYVVAPPSTVRKIVEHEKGLKDKIEKTYEWIRSPEDTLIAEFPQLLLEELTKQPERSTSLPVVEEVIPEGSRNTTLFSRARSLFKQGYNESEVYGLLDCLNQNRCTPPVGNDELDEIVISASKYDRGELFVAKETSNESTNTETGGILQPMDLGKALVEGIEPPEHLINDLLYAEGIHSIYSPGGTGKTILALWCCLKVMERGLDVLYVDEENGAHHIAELLSSFEVEPELISNHFKYLPAPGLTKEEIEVWKLTVEHFNPALVVFDSLADHLSNNNLSENNALDVTWWIRQFAQPVKDTDAAVLILDHVAKADDAKGARGSTAKMAKVDVAWKLKSVRPFNRDTTGEVELKVDKDRKGSMPYSKTFRIGGDDFTSRLICEPTDVSHEPETKPLNSNEETVLDTLWTDFPNGARHGEWLKASGIPKATFNRVIGNLVSVGYVEKNEVTGWYHVVSNKSHDTNETQPIIKSH